jgi:VCBS repeat-containing protein
VTVSGNSHAASDQFGVRKRALITTFAVVSTALLTLALALAAAPASAKLTSTAADRAALRALGSTSGSKPVVVFRARRPLARGTVIAQAGTSRSAQAGAAAAPDSAARRERLTRAGATVTRAPVVLRVGSEPAWMYYEDRGPFQLYEHPGRVALVGVMSGKVTLSRTLDWPPLAGGRLPLYLRSADGYRSARYRVFTRLPKAARASTRAASRPVATGAQALAGAAAAGSAATTLAREDSCAVTIADMLDDSYDYASVDRTRAAFGGLLAALEQRDRGFVAARYSTADGLSPTAFVDRLVRRHGCRSVLLFIAGGGVEGDGTTVSLGVSAHASGRMEQQDLRGAELKALLAAHPQVDWQLVVDAPYAGGLVDELKEAANLRVLLTASEADETTFACLPGHLRVCPASPPQLAFTSRLITGLTQVLTDQGAVDRAVAASGSASPFAGRLLADAYDRGSPAGALSALGQHPRQYVNFGPAGAGSPQGLNLLPFAHDQSVTTNEDTAVTIDLANGDALQALLGSYTIDSPPAHGRLSGSGRFVTYTPDADFNGTDAFVFRLRFAAVLPSTGRVTVTVRAVADAPVVTTSAGATAYREADPPVAVDGALTVRDADSANLTGATAAISGGYVGGQDVLAFRDTGAITGSWDAGRGVLRLTGSAPRAAYEAALRSITYANTSVDPTAGTRQVTFTATDGALTSAPASKDVAVTAVNDAPVVTLAGGSVAYTENDPATVLDGGLTVRDADSPNLAGATVTIVRGLAAGEDVLEATGALPGGITARYTAASGTLALSGTASLADYQAALRLVGYRNTSDAPSSATRTVEVVVTDTGTARSAPVSRDVTVAPVNDRPVANDDAYDTGEDDVLTIASPGVLGNDRDADGDRLSVTELNGSAADVGTTVALPSGALLSVAADGSLSYDPNGQFTALRPGETATDTVPYTVADGNGGSSSATVSVTVRGANDSPVAADDSYDTSEDDVLTVASPGVLGNDRDADGDTLTVDQVDGDAGNVGRSFRTTRGATVTVRADGSLSYDPTGAFDALRPGDTATDTLTYRAGDGSSGDTATITVTVRGANDRPDANDDAYDTSEDDLLAVAAPGLLGNDTDADGDSLTVDQVDGDGANVGRALRTARGATVTVNADGSLTYDPNGAFDALRPGEEVRDTFTYRATDGAAADTATVTVTVSGAADAPVAADDSYETLEDDALTVPAGSGVLANDRDPEGDSLTVDQVDGDGANVGRAFRASSGATVTVNADGSLSYDPNGQFNDLRAGETVRDTVTYRVTDGVASDTATISFTIRGTNDRPDATDDGYDTYEDTPLTVAGPGVLANDTDPDRGTLLLVDQVDGSAGNVGRAFRTARGATVRVNADGALSYDPTGVFDALRPGQTATDTFTYRATDGIDGDLATVTVTVRGVNDAPTGAPDSFAGVGNTTLVVSDPAPSGEASKQLTGFVTDNDTDPDDPVSSLSVRAESVTTRLGGSATIDTDGSFTYVPPTGTTGSDDTFQYEVSDGDRSSRATVTVRLTGRVWYVDNTDAAGGTGRSGDAFDTLAEADAAAGSGDTIYVHRGDGTTRGMSAGITLGSNERLLGEAQDLVVGGDMLYDGAAARRPSIANTGGTGVALGSGSTVSGLAISAAGGAAIAGRAGVAGSTISDANVTGSAGGISLSGTSGTFNVSDTTVQTTGGTGLAASAAGTLNLQSAGTVSVRSTGGQAVAVNDTALSGTIDTVSASGAAGGVSLQRTTGAIALGDVSVDVSGGTGFLADAVAGLSVPAAGTVTVRDTGGTAVAIRNSAAPAASFDSVSATGSGSTGVDVSGNSGSGAIGFTGPVTVSSGAATGVRLATNASNTIAFQGGGLGITTTAGDGLSATGGGTVTVAGSGNTIASGSGTALRIANTTIGAADATFQSIAANGGANGIVLDTTGSAGSLAVTGTGTANSGGTIQNIRGADGTSNGVGVYLNNTTGVSLTAMHLTNNDGHAIRGTTVNGFTLDRSTVDGTNGTNDSVNEGSISLSDLTGASAITNSSVSGGYEDNADIASTRGTLNLTLDNDTFGANGTTAGGNSLLVEAGGTSDVTTSVTRSAFTSSREDLVQHSVSGTAQSEFTFDGNTLSNNHSAPLGGNGLIVGTSGSGAGADLTYRVSNNRFTQMTGGALAVFKGVGIADDRGTIEGNTIGTAGVVGSGAPIGSGIWVESRGQGSHVVRIANNTVRQYRQDGIRTVNGETDGGVNGNVDVDMTVTGNTVTEPNGSRGATGFRNEAADPAAVVDECLDFRGNVMTGSAGSFSTEVRVLHDYAGNVVRLPGYTGAAQSDTDVMAYLSRYNTATTVFASVPGSGPGFVNAGAACVQPTP